jgi:hypothetical protein
MRLATVREEDFLRLAEIKNRILRFCTLTQQPSGFAARCSFLGWLRAQLQRLTCTRFLAPLKPTALVFRPWRLGLLITKRTRRQKGQRRAHRIC